jgi:hypothetical protein
MTTRIQIALISAHPGAAVAIVNAVSRTVMEILRPGIAPLAADLYSGVALLAVELPGLSDAIDSRFANIAVGYPLPDDLIPEALRPLLNPMATAEFAPVPQPPSTGASMLLTDIDAVFKFANGDQVRIGASRLTGTVDGRSDYKSGERRYLVRFNDKDGMPKEDWYEENALSHVGDDGDDTARNIGVVVGA